jgi:hypothetical protein
MLGYLFSFPVYGKSVWLECPKSEGYLLNLDEKRRTYTLNDWFLYHKGTLQLGGEWHHGPALFSPRQVEFTFAKTIVNNGKRYFLKKRIKISRIDLRFQEFISRKIDDGEWSEESVGFSQDRSCVITRDPGIKNRI